MKIQKINFLPQKQQSIQKENNSQNNSLIQNNSYNPIAYQDFNINFGARLFRTPENFYAQPFNQNGMPDTMKEYLYDDFEDRQKMPPAQMLKVVFSDIKNAKSLEEVKKAYPEEKLFNNLSDTPNRKARTGILAEIDLLKEPDKSLFKNGKDNLGLYILNKIYIEGKTLKEINTDFAKDISVYYKGLSPIEYDTLSAHGIKYPDNGFWKSMTATRTEFPYEYKPRKAIESRITSPHQINKNATTPAIKPKNKFQDVQNWEVEKLTEALIKGNGSKVETEKQLKKRNVQNKESQNFVSKYMGEINTIVLEKLHISEDMKDFFENYDGLSKNQKEKFDEYMKIPYINELRSKVMSHTIRLFFDTYGVDGNNEDFQELLQYAHEIKPNRIARQAEHDRLQAEYEEALGIFDNEPVEEEVTAVIEEDDDDDDFSVIQKYKDEIEKIKKEFDVKSYEFKLTDGSNMVALSNLKSALAEKMDMHYPLMPSAFCKKYAEFTANHPLSSENYLLSIIFSKNNIKKDDRFIPHEEIQNITVKIANDCEKKYPSDIEAAQQAIIDAAVAAGEVNPELYLFNPIGCAIETLPLADNDDIAKTLKNISNEQFAKYKKQLTTKEVLQITNKIVYTLEHSSDASKKIKTTFDLAKAIMSYDNEYRMFVKKEIQKTVRKYGGSARCLLDNNFPDELKMEKVQRVLYYCPEFETKLMEQVGMDPELLRHLAPYIKIGEITIK